MPVVSGMGRSIYPEPRVGQPPFTHHTLLHEAQATASFAYSPCNSRSLIRRLHSPTCVLVSTSSIVPFGILAVGEQHPPKSPNDRRTQDHCQVAKHRPSNLIHITTRTLLQHARIRGAFAAPDSSPLLTGWDKACEQQRRPSALTRRIDLSSTPSTDVSPSNCKFWVAIEHLAASWHNCEVR